ncbi:MAG: general secretion pathway protein C [Pseudomonadota bacterium]|nr:general secretion pathway protein C [Pseudomonadota bacterium]
MRLRLSPRLAASLAALLVWALVAGSALFWYLRAGDAGLPRDVAVAGAAGGVAVDTRTVARALGAPDGARAEAAPAADVTSRLALRGIVTHGGRGAALIAVDGQPPKPVRVGGALEGVDGWSVRSLSPGAVVIAAGEREARLEMPPLAQRSSAGDAVARPLPGQAFRPPNLPAAPPPAVRAPAG